MLEKNLNSDRRGEIYDLEYIKCDICSTDDALPLRRIRPFNLVRCKKCGLIYINPRPREISLQYESGESSPFAYYIRNTNADSKTFSYILSILSKYKIGGRLLDIGCGVGTFLLVARAKGYSVKGMDINRHCVEYCRNVLSLDVEYGPSENISLSDRFDIVTLLSVIEHLPSPSKMLKLVTDVLSDKGILVISMMNTNSWATRKFQTKPKEHLYYFDTETIKKILINFGFRILDLEIYDPYRDIASLFFSSTFNKRPLMRSLLNIIRSLLGSRSLLVKFPFKENIIVIAEKL